MNLKEVFKDALPIIERVAPSIAGAIGGPVGLAAGYVLPILAHSFGGDSTNLVKLAGNIFNDPNAHDKLQTIEEQYGDWVASLMMSVNHLESAEISVKLSWQDYSKQ